MATYERLTINLVYYDSLQEQPEYRNGLLAVCNFCGYSSVDFTRCQRCNRKFPPNVRSVSASSVLKPIGNSSQVCCFKKGAKSILTNTKFINIYSNILNNIKCYKTFCFSCVMSQKLMLFFAEKFILRSFK